MPQIVRVNNVLSDGTIVPVYPAGIQPIPPTVRTISRLGVNLEGPYDYNQTHPFIDLVRTCRQPFGQPSTPYTPDGTIPVDANGWPKADFGVLLFANQANVGGNYAFSFTGKGTVGALSSFGVVSQSYDATTNTTSGVLFFPASSTPANGYIGITATDRNDGSGFDGVTKLKVLRPGYTSAEGIFTREFLTAVAPFGTVRFMDAQRTNGQLVEEWADRNTMQTASWSLGSGWPYEAIIAFMNVTQKDVWINIPSHASEDFVEELANYLMVNAPEHLRIYFEYSNEVWNGLFEQFDFGTDEALARVTGGDTLLGATGPNKFYWSWARTAEKALELKQLLGTDDRFRAVYATQLGYSPAGLQAQVALDYIEALTGDAASDYFYGIAVAPYYGAGNSVETVDWDRDDLTATEVARYILEGAQDNTATKTRFLDFKTVSASYGLKLLAYEGGVDITQADHSVPAKSAAQKLPDAGLALTTSVGSWLSSDPNTVYCYFTLCGKDTKDGYWGLTESVNDLSQAKYLAASAVASKNVSTDSIPPYTPTNLRARAGGPSNIQIRWADNSPPGTSTKIERKIGSGSWTPLVTIVTPNAYYQDTTVTPGTTYGYRVYSVGPTPSAASNEAYATAVGTVVTPPTPVVPVAPTSLVATALTPTSVGLTWTDNATNEYGYRVERKSVATGGWAVLTTLAANGASYTDTNAMANTAYLYRVTATGDTDSASSNLASVTTPPTTGPTTTADVVPWGICANTGDSLEGLRVAFATVKKDGGEWVRFWASPFGLISQSNADRILAAKAAGLKTIVALQGKDNGAFVNFGNPDMAFWANQNKGILKSIDMLEVGNELNLSQYRYNDWGDINSWHDEYVNRFLKPLYQAVHPMGVKVAVVSITYTTDTALYANQYDKLLTAGALAYCDAVAIHFYTTPAKLGQFAAVVAHLRSTWPGKSIVMTEANVNFNGLSESALKTQFLAYATVLRTTAKIDVICYYRGMVRSDGQFALSALFNKAGIPLPKYTTVRDALTK